MAANNATTERLMDVEQLASRLGVKVRYVRRLVAERRIPYLKVGRLIRFDPGEVAVWIDGARIAPIEARTRASRS